MNIKQLRESLNMTQDDFSKRLGVSRSTVAMWEIEQTVPRLPMLKKIAKVFGCKMSELLGEEQI